MWRTCVSEHVTKKAQLSIMYCVYELVPENWCEDSGITALRVVYTTQNTRDV